MPNNLRKAFRIHRRGGHTYAQPSARERARLPMSRASSGEIDPEVRPRLHCAQPKSLFPVQRIPRSFPKIRYHAGSSAGCFEYSGRRRESKSRHALAADIQGHSRTTIKSVMIAGENVSGARHCSEDLYHATRFLPGEKKDSASPRRAGEESSPPVFRGRANDCQERKGPTAILVDGRDGGCRGRVRCRWADSRERRILIGVHHACSAAIGQNEVIAGNERTEGIGGLPASVRVSLEHRHPRKRPDFAKNLDREQRHQGTRQELRRRSP